MQTFLQAKIVILLLAILAILTSMGGLYAYKAHKDLEAQEVIKAAAQLELDRHAAALETDKLRAKYREEWFRTHPNKGFGIEHLNDKPWW